MKTPTVREINVQRRRLRDEVARPPRFTHANWSVFPW